ncbi:MAG: hypothetical protein IKI58_08695, partial [Oscillospiraceae bacterium]|nr:hypothetical protein [Oscillospiraceae bacterium]
VHLLYRSQSVEKPTDAHTEGEIKVLIQLFQKLAGIQRAAPSGRRPQTAKRPVSIKKALKIGAWGKENKSFPSPIIILSHLF